MNRQSGTKEGQYWDERRETMPPVERGDFIFAKIKKQLAFVYATTPFYRDLYDRHGVRLEEVANLGDFTRKIPVVTKEMLREDRERHPPFGSYLGIDAGEIARVQSTSGTTGKPSYLASSLDDRRHIARAGAMQCWSAGMRPEDIVQIALPLGQFVGGWGVLDAAEHIGAATVPVGGRDTYRQLTIMHDVGSTVLCTTPSFGLYLLEEAGRLGYDAARSPLRIGFFVGEPGAGIPEIKKKLEEGWGIRAIDMGNVAEMHPCSNMECEERTGMHAWIDIDYTEIVDPEDPSSARPAGEPGAIIYTHLWRKSQPMIRYHSGDEAHLSDDPCPCGRTYPRFPDGIYGRLDDKLLIRGLSVYPSAIEGALRATQGIGLEFRLDVKRKGHFDSIEVRAEYDRKLEETGKKQERLTLLAREAERMIRQYTGINCPVSIVPPETFERMASKARRMVDLREKDPF